MDYLPSHMVRCQYRPPNSPPFRAQAYPSPTGQLEIVTPFIGDYINEFNPSAIFKADPETFCQFSRQGAFDFRGLSVISSVIEPWFTDSSSILNIGRHYGIRHD